MARFLFALTAATGHINPGLPIRDRTWHPPRLVQFCGRLAAVVGKAVHYADTQIICTRCRKNLQPGDWTCPVCGAISERILFDTVTLKSLEGAGRDAYGNTPRLGRPRFNRKGIIQPLEAKPPIV